MNLDQKNNAFSFEESIAFNFIQLSKRVKNKEKILRISEIIWPMILIQAEPNYKLMIDKVGVSNFDLNLINAPLTANIGSELRNKNIDNIQILENCKKVLNFNKDKSNNKEISRNKEFFNKKINGLINPKLLEGFGKILSNQINYKKGDLLSLESIYTFDDSLGIGKIWFQTLNQIQGFKQRWKELYKFIEKPINLWKKELIVKIKSVEELYIKQIRKSQELDDNKIQHQLNKEKDSIDYWLNQEQKNIIEKIGKMFFGIDSLFGEIRKKNKYFLQIDSLKARNSVGEVVLKAFQNVANIRELLYESEDKLEKISQKLNVIRKDLQNTNISAEERLHLRDSELKEKHEFQKVKIQNLLEEKKKKIFVLENKLEKIRILEKEMNLIIENKTKETHKNIVKMRKWQINDNITDITNPTKNIFIPIGIAIIEDEFQEERVEIIFPSKYICENYEIKRIPLSNEFIDFEKKITDILDGDMRLRSNFEFTCEDSTIGLEPIRTGLKFFKQKKFIDPISYNKYIEILNSIE